MAGASFLAVAAVNDRARHSSLVHVANVVLIVLVVFRSSLGKCKLHQNTDSCYPHDDASNPRLGVHHPRSPPSPSHISLCRRVHLPTTTVSPLVAYFYVFESISWIGSTSTLARHIQSHTTNYVDNMIMPALEPMSTLLDRQFNNHGIESRFA